MCMYKYVPGNIYFEVPGTRYLGVVECKYYSTIHHSVAVAHPDAHKKTLTSYQVQTVVPGKFASISILSVTLIKSPMCCTCLVSVCFVFDWYFNVM